MCNVALRVQLWNSVGQADVWTRLSFLYSLSLFYDSMILGPDLKPTEALAYTV